MAAYPAKSAYPYSGRGTAYGATGTDVGTTAADAGPGFAADVGPAVYAPVLPPAHVPPAKVYEDDEEEVEEIFRAPHPPPERAGPNPILILAIAVITIGGVIALVFYSISRNDLELTSPRSTPASRKPLTQSTSTGPTETTDSSDTGSSASTGSALENAQLDVTASPGLDGTDDYDATSDAAPTLDS